MAYVAAKGGEYAIQAAEQFFRTLNGHPTPAFVLRSSAICRI